jgi:hypothetical protein
MVFIGDIILPLFNWRSIWAVPQPSARCFHLLRVGYSWYPTGSGGPSHCTRRNMDVTVRIIIHLLGQAGPSPWSGGQLHRGRTVGAAAMPSRSSRVLNATQWRPIRRAASKSNPVDRHWAIRT